MKKEIIMLSLQNQIGKVISRIFLFLLSMVLFTHIFTYERNSGSFIEYDQHFVIFSFFLIVSSLSLLILLKKRDYKLKFDFVCLVLGALLIYIIIQSLFNSFVENRLVINLTLLYILYLIFKQVFINKQGYRMLVFMFLISSILQACIFVVNISFFEHTFHSIGAHINTGVNMNYFTSVCPFLLGLSFYYRHRKSNLLAGISFLTCFIYLYIILDNNARISWIATLSGCGYILFWKLDLKNKILRLQNNKPWGLNYLGIAVLICGLTAGAYFIYQYKPDSSRGRVLISAISTNILKDNVFTGAGLNRFESFYNHYQATYFKSHHNLKEELLADNTFFAFNEFLQGAIEFGIAGLLIISILIYVVFKKHSRNLLINDNLYSGGRGALISVGICALCSYPFHTLSIGVNLIFFLALFSAGDAPVISAKISVNRHYFVPVITLMLLLSLYVSIKEYKYMIALKKWSYASYLAETNNFNNAKTIYQSIYPDLSGNGRFLFNYGSELSISGNYSESIKILKMAELLYPNYNLYIYLGQSYQYLNEDVAAERSYKYASIMVPSRFLSKFLLFKLYEKNGNKKEIKKMADEILNYPVKIPSKEVNEYKRYVIKRGIVK